MIEFFLRSKAWVLFTLTFLLPLAIHVGGVFLPQLIHDGYFGDIGSDNGRNLWLIWYTVAEWISTLFGVVLYLWYWAIVYGLSSQVSESLGVNVGTYKGILILQVILDIGISIWNSILNLDLFPELTNDLYSNGYYSTSAPHESISIFMAIVSLGLMIYLIYYAAKTIRTAEQRSSAKFGDSIGMFFLILFHPIGVWSVQPRLNKLTEREMDPLLDHLVED